MSSEGSTGRLRSCASNTGLRCLGSLTSAQHRNDFCWGHQNSLGFAVKDDLVLAFFPYCATESVRGAGAGLASVKPPAPQTKECEGKAMERKLGRGLLLLGDSNLVLLGKYFSLKTEMHLVIRGTTK